MGENSLLRSEWEQLRAAFLGNLDWECAPIIVPYEEPRIESVWRDVNVDMQLLQKLMSTTMLTAKMPIAVYDEEQEPCTDEELQEFLFNS